MVRPAQQGPQARHQLAHRIRLHEIVVGPKIQAGNAILHAIARGRHQHAGRRDLGAECGAERESVVVGQPNIEDHGVIGANGRQFAGHLPGRRRIHRKAGRAQKGRCAFPQHIVVFYQQHSQTGECTAWMTAA